MTQHQRPIGAQGAADWGPDWSAVSDMGAELADTTAEAMKALRGKLFRRIVFAILGAYWVGVLLSTWSTIVTLAFLLVILILAADVATGFKTFGSVFGFGAIINGFPNVELLRILGIGGPVKIPDFQLKKAAEEGWKLALKAVIVPVSAVTTILGLVLLLFAFVPPAWGRGTMIALVALPVIIMLAGAIVVWSSGLDPKQAPAKANIRNAAYGLLGIFAIVAFFGIYDGKGAMAEAGSGKGLVGAASKIFSGYQVVYEVPPGTSINHLPPVVLPKDMEPGMYRVEVSGDPKILTRIGTQEDLVSILHTRGRSDLPRPEYGVFGPIIEGARSGDELYVSKDTLNVRLNIPEAYRRQFDLDWNWRLESPIVFVFKKI